LSVQCELVKLQPQYLVAPVRTSAILKVARK
jgi:hypothetical protein